MSLSIQLSFLFTVCFFPYLGIASDPVKIILTFDDGPSNEKLLFSHETPTQKILKTLRENKIKAAFFVLTYPDRFLFKTYPKAETPLGFQTLKDTIAQGHIIGLHWGGSYVSQFALHTSRLALPAYDSTDDGKIDKVTSDGNALESDLLQSLELIGRAKEEIGVSRKTIFVRPPLWVYKDNKGDARPTYNALGLRMILSDAKFLDAGYATHVFSNHFIILHGILAALKKGKKDIIVTFHDSNTITATLLPTILPLLKYNMEFLGHKYGKDWTFAETTDEVYQGLMNRKF